MRSKICQKSFSLIEMLLSISIFVLIVVVVCSIHILSQQNYREGEIEAELVQNGRVVAERIVREIRQAKEIVTELPQERIDAPSEIKFQDGHLPVISEQDIAQSAESDTIVLSSSSSQNDDYYKDLFIEIISGTGTGQIRKIYSYNGSTKTAVIESGWDIIPDVTSEYIIDSSFYYIYYYKDEENDILRKVIAYCFSEDLINCSVPGVYVKWNAVPETGSTIEVVLEDFRIIGENVLNLEFWGSQVVNIYLGLEIENKRVDLQTKVFGRNL